MPLFFFTVLSSHSSSLLYSQTRGDHETTKWENLTMLPAGIIFVQIQVMKKGSFPKQGGGCCVYLADN